MMNGVNYFSMHRQIVDQQKSAEAAIQAQRATGGKSAEAIEKLTEIKKGAEAFESYFIQTLLKEMRKGVPKGEAGGVGLREDMYQSMFDEAIAEKIAKSGGMGLAKLLSEKMSESLKPSNEAFDSTHRTKDFKPIHR
ncbi:MAG: rod-binding protein [Nitrospiria bacterium]